MNGGDNTTVKLTKISEIVFADINEPLSDCLDELKRELAVRFRIYDRWVSEGRLSYTTARDQYNRLAMAVKVMAVQAEIEATNIEQKKAFDEVAASMPPLVEVNAE